jgi:alpha-galactosidase
VDEVRSQFEVVGEYEVDLPSALLYVEGWQSWSQAGRVGLQAAPFRPDSQSRRIINFRSGPQPPEAVHESAGVLAVVPAAGAPVVVIGATSGEQVPRIRAEVSRALAATAPSRARIVISADAPVVVRSDDGMGGVRAALGRFVDQHWSLPPALRAVPGVWCSWYHYFERVRAADVLDNLRALDEFGVEAGVVQVDDGYADAPGDWLVANPAFGDLRAVVDAVRSSGRRAGLWVAPFVVGRRSRLFAEHPDWVLRDGHGEVVSAGPVLRDECAVLDVDVPGAAHYLRSVLEEFAGWGIDYFKFDFLYAGALHGHRASGVDAVTAYRHGLGLLRDAIGADAYLVGCGAPLLPSVGLVDAMRIGPDVAPHWEPANGGPSSPAQSNAMRNVIERAWMQGRLWVNDPDCLVARPGIQERERWAATLATYGGLRSCSDDLRQLDAWGLQTTRALIGTADLGPVL